MANLKTEYTDIRNRTHSVEHILLPTNDAATQEQLIEELILALHPATERRQIP